MKQVLIILVLCVCFACENQNGIRNEKRRVSKSTSVYKKQDVKANKDNEIRQPKTGQKIQSDKIFDLYNSAVFMIVTSDSRSKFQGSGFFVNKNGLAVSNYHVFEGTTVGMEIVKLSNGTICKVKEVVAKSKEYDYIVFKVDISGTCNYIPVSNRQKKVGEKVYAIGSPLGLENTFSSGEISQLRGNYVIQINAPIDHGSSGGALINEYGEAIGITSAGIDDSSANLNFALDILALKHHIH